MPRASISLQYGFQKKIGCPSIFLKHCFRHCQAQVFLQCIKASPSHAWPSGCCGGAVSLLLKDIHISSTALLEIAAILCLLLYSLSSRDGHCAASVGKTLCSTLVWLLYFAFFFFFSQSRAYALFILSCRDHICRGELSGGSWRAEMVAIAFPSFPFFQVS